MTVDAIFASNSITTNHDNILTMLKLIDRAIIAMRAESHLAASAQTAKIVEKLSCDAASARETYYVGVSPYIVAHGLLIANLPENAQPDKTRKQEEEAIRMAYLEFIGEKNVIGIIDRCIETITTLLKLAGASLDAESDREFRDISSAIEKADQFRVTIGIESVTTGDCECGGEFVLYAESNERKCGSCGMTATIYDNAIDDMNMYSQDMQKAKQNRHHPIQHCKTWVGRIQAWVGPNVPDSVYTQLRVCFTRDKVILKNVTCRSIRKYLKEKKLTAYNNFVPFIRKVLTGVSPPQLTQSELTRLYDTFSHVAKILQDMRPDNNINYYPVFIFKILDEQLPFGTRKVQIMECIHLQSENTVKVIDNLYAQVCARMGRTDKPKAINWGEYKKLL
jgi:hypothetical protein